jgi:hypothetical protein
MAALDIVRNVNPASVVPSDEIGVPVAPPLKISLAADSTGNPFGRRMTMRPGLRPATSGAWAGEMTSIGSGNDKGHRCACGRFALEWLYHVFYPISLPLVWLVDGLVYSHNHRWAVWTPQQGFAIALPTLWFSWMPQVAIGLCWYYYYSVSRNEVTSIEVIQMVFTLVFHRMMVATKYALYPQHRMQDLHVRSFDAQELADLELFSWYCTICSVCVYVSAAI